MVLEFASLLMDPSAAWTSQYRLADNNNKRVVSLLPAESFFEHPPAIIQVGQLSISRWIESLSIFNNFQHLKCSGDLRCWHFWLLSLASVITAENALFSTGLIEVIREIRYFTNFSALSDCPSMFVKLHGTLTTSLLEDTV